jgi:hypothetical protein
MPAKRGVQSEKVKRKPDDPEMARVGPRRQKGGVDISEENHVRENINKPRILRNR